MQKQKLSQLEILRRFKEGVRNVCVQKIMSESEVDDWISDRSQEQAAQVLKIDRGTLSAALAYGTRIGITGLFIIVTEMNIKFHTHILPSRRERFDAGLQEVMKWAQGELKINQGEKITLEAFIATYALLGELSKEEFAKRQARGNLDSCTWKKIAQGVQERIRHLLGLPTNGITPFSTAAELHALREKWGEIVGEVKLGIPTQWLNWIREE